MAMLRKFIAIFAISFIGIAGTSNADILYEIPADIRDYVYDPNFMDPMQPLGESVLEIGKVIDLFHGLLDTQDLMLVTFGEKVLWKDYTVTTFQR